MPPEEAGYTYAVEPAATNQLLANEEESIYRRPKNLARWRPSLSVRIVVAWSYLITLAS
jgi:hypothetical protein